MRAAIYARYSSDLQRPSSIEDQIHQCERAAEQNGWTILREYVRSDSEVSGATLNLRDGLTSLIADAKKTPRPFDYLLLDDTSRLGRNLTDVLRVSEILRHCGVFLYFVSQRIDSHDDRIFRQLLIMNGMADEHLLMGLADKVHRGQEGRVLKGQVPGGRCYGYRNVPIEDPTRQGEYGRPAVLGVDQEIDRLEAAVLIRMFELYADGFSLGRISKDFNAGNILAPPPPQGENPSMVSRNHSLHAPQRALSRASDLEPDEKVPKSRDF